MRLVFYKGYRIMAGARDIEDLKIWQEGRDLVKVIYDLSEGGKFARDFALRDQMRKTSISVMANIAEGFGWKSDREFYRFLDIARGSIAEVRSHLHAALVVGYISQIQFKATEGQYRLLGVRVSAMMRYLAG